MKSFSIALLCASISLASIAISHAQESSSSVDPQLTADAPDSGPAASAVAAKSGIEPRVAAGDYAPFRSVAIAFRIGSGGIGAEIGTPLGHNLTLRGGAQFFSYDTKIEADGLHADGDLTLQNVHFAVDYFLFHNGFRISPGLTVHNDNHIAAALSVPPGGTFTLNDTDYTSSATDPVTGEARVFFGNKVAPRITLGYGNMFPRFGRHWSFPVEAGFEYTSRPTVQLSLGGSACSDMGCGSINTPDNQANIAAQQTILANDISGLRFFPIVSFGVSYRIGR